MGSGKDISPLGQKKFLSILVEIILWMRNGEETEKEFWKYFIEIFKKMKNNILKNLTIWESQEK